MTDRLPLFFEKVDITEACWLWTAGCNPDGYGMFWNGETNEVAHRWLYKRVVGAITDGRELDHLCRQRRCVNPDHLEQVTHTENVARGRAGAPNREKTHCRNGHAFTPENTYTFTGTRRGRICRTCNKVAVHKYQQKTGGMR